MLRVKKEFVLREIAGEYILTPVGKTALEFNGMVTINHTSAMMWEMLERGTTFNDLVGAVAGTYDDVSNDEVTHDVKCFLNELLELDFISKTDDEVF